MRVLVHDPHARVQDVDIAQTGFEQLLAQADYVVCLASSNAQTENLMNTRAASQMPTLALAKHPQVIATPHIGGLTPPATRHQALETVSQCADILRGRVPTGAVNATDATRWLRLAQA